MFFLTFTADPSLGRIDKATLPEQALMELVIQGISNRVLIYHPPETIADITKWYGLTFYSDGAVRAIFWPTLGLKGTLPLEWLPLRLWKLNVSRNMLEGTLFLENLPETLEHLQLEENRFEGTLYLENLPKGLYHLNVSNNRLSGTISLKNLPEGLHTLNLSINGISGETDFSQLPKTLTFINLSMTDLSGDIIRTNSMYLNVFRSNITIDEKRKSVTK